MKRIISFLILVIFIFNNAFVYAADRIKFYGGMQTEFTTGDEFPDCVEFITNEEVKVNDDIIIPAGALINAKVHQFQKERRWHKSGFFICNLMSYSLPEEGMVDLSDKEIYFIVRKYEALNKKEAGILGTEIVLTQAASIVASCFIIFAPVDIAYFFTKGAITRKKDKNWFKAGVKDAYDNSIFWFQLKGKPIDLAEGDSIKLKSLSKERADKITTKIEKRKSKKAYKQQKRENKKLCKQQKRDEKIALKQQKHDEKQARKQQKLEEKRNKSVEL